MAVRQITTRLAIDGEQEYKKQLAAVNRELGNLGAEMKLVDAQFKGQANSSEALRAKHNLLKQSIEQQVGKIVSLQGAVEEATAAFGEADSRTDSYRRQLLSAETALAKLNDELSENEKLLKEAEDSADGCAKSIDGYGKAVKDAADETDDLHGPLGEVQGALKGLRNEDGSFNLGNVTKALGTLKGALVGGAIVTGVKAVNDAIFSVVESTKEYREVMGKLEISSKEAGYTWDETYESYSRLQAVLGDTQTAATVVSNLQAIGLAQGDLNVLIDQVIGAWVKYEDSIPIDGLSESINETIQAAKVTGTFADVLNWAGENEEEFNKLLEEAPDKMSRYTLVAEVLTRQGLAEMGKEFYNTNQDIVAMNESQEKLNAAMAKLGEVLVPYTAWWIDFRTEAVETLTTILDFIYKVGSAMNQVFKINGDPQRDLSSENAAAYDRYLKDFARGYNGSHAAGLDRVPYDGYIAELHANEAVLNAQEAALWRSAARYGASGAPAASSPAPSPAAVQGAARRENVTIDVTLELDGQTLARKQYPLMQAEGRRRGTPLAGKEGT